MPWLPSRRLIGIAVSLALLLAAAACSPTQDDAPEAGEGSRTGEADRETTPSGSVVGASEPGRADVPATWDYVALGDSLAVGVGAERGYVDRYAGHLRDDTGAGVRVTNLGVGGQTSAELLDALRNDPATRGALREAEVVTFNIGINDLGQAGRSHRDGTCGGPDNEACLRGAVDEVEENWDAVTEEILVLSPTNETVVRTAGLGYTPDVGGVYEPYLAEVNRHIAASAARNRIPHVQVRLGPEGMSPDGIHPDDGGYAEIAARLRTLGYAPLETR